MGCCGFFCLVDLGNLVDLVCWRASLALLIPSCEGTVLYFGSFNSVLAVSLVGSLSANALGLAAMISAITDAVSLRFAAAILRAIVQRLSLRCNT